MRKKRNLSGKFALVTGAASGIGFCFASELLAGGASLILVDRNEKGLSEATQKLMETVKLSSVARPAVLTLTLDLTDSLLIEKIEKFCHENSVVPDILVNNAGIFSFAPITETDPKKIEIFIDLHVRALTMLSQWFCRLRSRYGNGYLLNMSSMSCWMPMPGLAMYASTKAYIRVFTRSLHYELRDSGVKVMVACPGGIATDLFGLPSKWQKFAVKIGVLDTPGRFVKKAVKKLLRGKKQYINGLVNRFSIFFIGTTPTHARMLVKHKLLDKGITR